MRRRAYLVIALCLSACALPHLERREQTPADQAAGGEANLSSSAQAGSAGKAESAGAAGGSGAAAAGSGTAGRGDLGAGSSGAPDTSDAGEPGFTSGGSTGSGGVSGGSIGGSGGVSGGSIGGSGASGGSAGGGGTSGMGSCTTKNACGGCAPLTGAVGDVCAGCGKLACNGFNALMCESTCAAPKAACNTTTNQCVACLGDTDCPVATPVCSTNNTCLVCKPSATGCSGTTPTSCNATGTMLSNGTVHSGTCGATCDPGALRCTNLLPQKCSLDGTAYVSSGSNTQCGCTDSGGRFTFISDKQVKDSLTGLIWDFPEHAPDTNAGASGTCTAKGMRLPTQVELEKLLLAAGPAAACTQKLYLSIDSVAFPGIVATTRYWTGEAEGGFPGYYYVVYFYGPTSQSSGSGYGTTDRMASQSVAYQCVQG